MNARRIVGAAAVAAVIGMPAVATAQTDYVGTTPPEVQGIEFTRPEPVKVLGTQETNDPGALPVTGGDLMGLAALGLGAVAVGTVLVRRGRTATASATA